MNYSICVPDNDFYIVIKFNAPVTRELALKSAMEAGVVAAETHGDKFVGYLVDSRGFPNVDTQFDNYEFAAIDSQRPQVDSSGPIAVVTSPGDDSHFNVELAMQHMGIDFRVFNEESMASGWLIEKIKAKRTESD